MSDDAEKTAMGDALVKYREAGRHLSLLSVEMKRIGQALVALGQALQAPDSYAISLDDHVVTLGKPNANISRPLGQIRDSDFNWDNLSRLIEDYQSTAATRNDLKARLEI